MQIHEYVTKWKCPDKYVTKLTNILAKYAEKIPEEYLKEIPKKFTWGKDGKTTSGFYQEYLALAHWDAEPIPFLEILEIDQEMGALDAAHVTNMVLSFQATKIIKDKNVRVLQKAVKSAYKLISELVHMGKISKAIFEDVSQF